MRGFSSETDLGESDVIKSEASLICQKCSSDGNADTGRMNQQASTVIKAREPGSRQCQIDREKTCLNILSNRSWSRFEGAMLKKQEKPRKVPVFPA